MRIYLRECCPTFSREKPEVKNPVGKSLWKTQIKITSSCKNKWKRGDLIMGSLWVVAFLTQLLILIYQGFHFFLLAILM